ncbi:MAG: hypothetical protein KF729_06140 [Sandaracinaceae bacterium]|nr:hypothetical protein [Sandaracinaceae bacterium]
MNKWITLALVGALAGCGGEEEAAPTPAPEPPAEPAAPAEPEAPAEPAAPAEPEAPALPPEPEPATPAAQTEGDVTLTAVRCTLDGPPIHRDSFGLPGVAVSPDGNFGYLPDQDGRLRRYRIGGAGDTCTFTLDTGFGEGGMLALGFGDGMGARIERVEVDRQGRVYVSTSMSGAVRVGQNGELTRCDGSRGGLAMAPDGSWGLATFVSTVRKITWTADGCTVEDNWTYPEAYSGSHAFSFSGNHLFVAGSVGTNHYQVQRYNGAGTATAGPRWGGAGLSDPNKICSPGNVVTGSRGEVVLDQNCRSFIVTSGGGNVVGRVNGMRLIGLRYPWIGNVTEPRNGVAYVSASHERGSGHRHYDQYVFRVSGL